MWTKAVPIIIIQDEAITIKGSSAALRESPRDQLGLDKINEAREPLMLPLNAW